MYVYVLNYMKMVWLVNSKISWVLFCVPLTYRFVGIAIYKTDSTNFYNIWCGFCASRNFRDPHRQLAAWYIIFSHLYIICIYDKIYIAHSTSIHILSYLYTYTIYYNDRHLRAIVRTRGLFRANRKAQLRLYA